MGSRIIAKVCRLIFALVFLFAFTTVKARLAFAQSCPQNFPIDQFGCGAPTLQGQCEPPQFVRSTTVDCSPNGQGSCQTTTGFCSSNDTCSYNAGTGTCDCSRSVVQCNTSGGGGGGNCSGVGDSCTDNGDCCSGRCSGSRGICVNEPSGGETASHTVLRSVQGKALAAT